MSSLANFLLAKRPKPKKKVTNGDMLRALAASQRDNTGVQLAIVEAKKSLALDAVCDSEVVIGAILKAHAATAVVKMIDNSEGALARHAEVRAEIRAGIKFYAAPSLVASSRRRPRHRRDISSTARRCGFSSRGFARTAASSPRNAF